MNNTVNLSNIFHETQLSRLIRGDRFVLSGKEFVYHKKKTRKLPRVGVCIIHIAFLNGNIEQWFSVDHKVLKYA